MKIDGWRLVGFWDGPSGFSYRFIGDELFRRRMLDGSSVGFVGIGTARKKGVFGVNLGSVYFTVIGTCSIYKSEEFFYLDFYSKNLIYHTFVKFY